jgi:hypothetical protein
MIARVVADLEPIFAQLRYLFPSHIVAFVVFEIEPFRDKESGRESVFQKQWPNHCEVRLGGIVKRKHHQFLWNWISGS